MKDNPTLNTCEGNVSFIFPRYGRSALLSNRRSDVSLSLQKSHTQTFSMCCPQTYGEQQLLCNIWLKVDVYFENISLCSHLQHVSSTLLVVKRAVFSQTTPVRARLVLLHGVDKTLILKRSTSLSKHLCRIQGGFLWYFINHFQIWPSLRRAGVAGVDMWACWELFWDHRLTHNEIKMSSFKTTQIEFVDVIHRLYSL